VRWFRLIKHDDEADVGVYVLYDELPAYLRQTDINYEKFKRLFGC